MIAVIAATASRVVFTAAVSTLVVALRSVNMHARPLKSNSPASATFILSDEYSALVYDYSVSAPVK